MINWLRRKLHSFIFPPDEPSKQLATVTESSDIDMDHSLRFYVLVGQGGVIVQLRSYDNKRDRTNNTTYVIPEGEDIATRVGEIVSLEIMKS